MASCASNPAILARGFCVVDHKVLLCIHQKVTSPCYFLPGGHVNDGESAKTCLQREFREEMDMHVDIGAWLGVVEHPLKPGFCHRQEYHMIFMVHPERCWAHDGERATDHGAIGYLWQDLGLLCLQGLSTPGLAAKLLRTWEQQRQQHAITPFYLLTLA